MQQPTSGWKQAFFAELARYLRTVAITFPLYLVVLALIVACMKWLGRPETNASDLGWGSSWPGIACKALFFACAFATSIAHPFRFVLKLIALVALAGAVGVYYLVTESQHPAWPVAGLVTLIVLVETGLIFRWATHWKAGATPESAPATPHESHGMTPAGD